MTLAVSLKSLRIIMRGKVMTACVSGTALGFDCNPKEVFGWAD